MTATKEDIDRYLDEDVFAAGDYKYVAISFCASETRQKLDVAGKVALKIRGAFATIEEGVEHIKQLHASKESFDTYLCDMGKWTLIGNVAGIDHPENHLVDMVRSVHQKNADHKKAFEERKERTKEHGLSEEDLAQAAQDAAPQTDTKKRDLSDITPLTMDSVPKDGTTTSFSSVDTIKVPDVNVVVLSFVERDPERSEIETPDGCVGVKFRGAFDTKKEAEQHLESTLSKLERDVDMFVVDMYKWLLLPPHIDDIKDVRYREDYLQEMFSTYEESQKAAKLHHIEREKAIAAADVMEEDSVHPTEIKAIEESGASGSGT